ncbi:type VI secretion system protein TssA [Inquilinus limosus]|uniref:type VI secretion system protein TssA n=1 Tax=Inquilinus limosus TaxID=171674 RepID=UPI003F5CCB17
MQTPDVLDIQSLTAPIAGANPAGEDLRRDFSAGAPFQRLRDLRGQVRAQERAADAEDDAAQPIAEWRQIIAGGAELLAQRSKDLEIAAMMVEGLARVHGYAGLRDGFRLAHALVEQHWDRLHPLPDEDGVATRLRPLIGLNGEGAEGTLIQPVRKIAMIRGQQGSYALWQIVQAGEIAALEPERRQQRLDAGGVDLDAVRQAGNEMDAATVTTLVADISGAQDAFRQLCAALDERCGPDSPPSSNIRKVLEAAQDAARLVLGDRVPAQGPAAAGDGAATGHQAPPAPSGTARPAALPGEIRDREDAFRLIELAAAWFRRMEPQAPISYTLEESVRRARLPLPDLLDELIRDETARGDFLIAAGIKPRSSG